jgi:hypothetical protein
MLRGPRAVRRPAAVARRRQQPHLCKRLHPQLGAPLHPLDGHGAQVVGGSHLKRARARNHCTGEGCGQYVLKSELVGAGGASHAINRIKRERCGIKLELRLPQRAPAASSIVFFTARSPSRTASLICRKRAAGLAGGAQQQGSVHAGVIPQPHRSVVACTRIWRVGSSHAEQGPRLMHTTRASHASVRPPRTPPPAPPSTPNQCTCAMV